MYIGEKFDSGKLASAYDVIVIGSGISGLTLACLQAQQGKSVLVLEKHYTAGGFTHTYQRKGYEWDTGLHYVGEVHREGHPLKELFDYITHGNLKWSKLPEHYDRFYFPDKTYSYQAGKENFITNLLKNFPLEEKALRNYLALIERMGRSLESFTKPKVLPVFLQDLLKTSIDPLFKENTYTVLKTLTSNEKLIAVLSGLWGDYALTPKKSAFGIHAVIALHYLEGAAFPVGGSSEIARQIHKVISLNGGHVFINTGVDKILIKNNSAIGVVLENGETVLAKNIASSAGLHQTFTSLVKPEDVPSEVRNSLSRLKSSTGYLALTIGINESPEILNHDGSNIWVYPGYDHDENLARYMSDPFYNSPAMNYISFPCLKDPLWKSRLGNKTAIDVLGVLPFDWVKEWEGSTRRTRPEAYKAFKEKIARPYFDALFKIFPQIENKIEIYEVSTPLTVKHYLNYQHGEIYGLNFDGKRFDERILRPQTSVKNLYLTGQDILVNGIAGAMMSGVLTSGAMSPIGTFGQLLPLGFFSKR